MEEPHYSTDDVIRYLRVISQSIRKELDEIKSAQAFNACQEYLRVPDIAALLDLSEATVRTYIKDGKLTAYKPGAHYIVPASSLREFMEQYRVV